jgi:hypothetical protein
MKKGVKIGKRFRNMVIVLFLVVALFWFFFVRSRKEGFHFPKAKASMIGGEKQTGQKRTKFDKMKGQKPPTVLQRSTVK